MILTNKTFYGLLVIAGLAFSTAATAAPTISSPYVAQGEAAAEVKTEYKFDDDDGDDDSWGVEVEAGYGITSFWEASIGVELEDEGHGEDAEFTGLAFKNKFQLATPGTLFVDPGLKLEYKRSLNGGADEVEAQLLLAKSIGKFMNKSEIRIAHEFGDDSDDETSYNFAYGLYYDYTEGFEFGAEWYSDFGDMTDDFDDQGHQFGPVAIFGLGESAELETGALFGVSDSAADVTLKAVLEYEF